MQTLTLLTIFVTLFYDHIKVGMQTVTVIIYWLTGRIYRLITGWPIERLCTASKKDSH